MIDIHTSWHDDICAAFSSLSPDYKDFLERGLYIPSSGDIFAAFKSLPKHRVRYILFGQDPYPREASATGYAFIDGAVKEIFSPSGLSKTVNRATSLRNFIKMALVAEGLLQPDDLSQPAIASIDKSDLIDSIVQLRENFEKSGVLLLNAALVFENKKLSARHARAWQPFVKTLLSRLDGDVELILFGGIAKTILKIPEASCFKRYTLEHPYNHTFILNEKAHHLFGPMHLLQKF